MEEYFRNAIAGNYSGETEGMLDEFLEEGEAGVQWEMAALEAMRLERPKGRKENRGSKPTGTALNKGALGLINECAREDPVDHMEEYFRSAIAGNYSGETEGMLDELLEEDEAGVQWEMAALEGMSVGGAISEMSGLDQPSLYYGDSTASSGEFCPQEPRLLPMEDVLREAPLAQPEESMAVIYKMCDDARCPLSFADDLMGQIRTEMLEHKFDPLHPLITQRKSFILRNHKTLGNPSVEKCPVTLESGERCTCTDSIS
jgi:hypothetical protein